jgi:6-phosphogluconolactonase
MWHPFETNDLYVAALSARITGILQAAIRRDGSACMAVSGGHSPIALFQALNRADIDWARVHIRLVDERFVSPENPDSNEHLVRTHLLQNRAAGAQFTGLVGDPANLEASLEQANAQDRPLTLAILGMGEDGHTASLFPGAAQLEDGLAPAATQRYLHVTPPDAAYERISMTLAALLGAQHLILAISGSKKRAVYEQAAKQASRRFPVSFVLNQSKAPIDVYWHS